MGNNCEKCLEIFAKEGDTIEPEYCKYVLSPGSPKNPATGGSQEGQVYRNSTEAHKTYSRHIYGKRNRPNPNQNQTYPPFSQNYLNQNKKQNPESPSLSYMDDSQISDSKPNSIQERSETRPLLLNLNELDKNLSTHPQSQQSSGKKNSDSAVQPAQPIPERKKYKQSDIDVYID